MTDRAISRSSIPDPDYLRLAPTADAAAAVPHPSLGFDGYPFGSREMLPTPSAEIIRDEVLRLRAQYRHLLPRR